MGQFLAPLTVKQFPTYYLVKWDVLKAGQRGEATPLGVNRRVCVHVSGTCDGAVLVIEGNVDGEWAFAKNTWGRAVAFRVPGIDQVGVHPLLLRPVVEGGSEKTQISVSLLIDG